MSIRNERKLTQMTQLLKTRPYSLEGLAFKYRVCSRTIRRWLEELEARGLRVVREGVSSTAPYRILRNSKKA